MKQISGAVVLCLFGLLCHAQTAAIAVIPTPALVKTNKGVFVWNEKTIIKEDAVEPQTVAFLNRFLHTVWKFDASATPGAAKTSTKQTVVYITNKGAGQLNPEGYRLSITPDSITLSGKGAGLFYGIQSLLQLFPNNVGKTAALPCMVIEDQPRFQYRGLMLDVSRHFFSVSQIKELLDLMAYYKLNHFHWHLTDDQGWRLEIKSFPKLTQVGAWRVPRLAFSGNTLPPQPGEKATDGGFYTQQQVKEIIGYAAERHIEVLPEIDVPGHSMAAVAAYPELCVTRDTTIKVNPGSSFAKWFPNGGGFEMYVDNTLNPTDERVYNFLDKVFGEVAALFPGKYIHVGGDECYKGFWERDSAVQVFMKQHNIADSRALQDYFISRVSNIIRSKGKTMIGWDEIFHGNIGEDVAIMNRFGEKGATEQTHKGLDIILAPGGNGFYFDYAQSESDMEPSSHGGNAPLWKSFVFDPMYRSLAVEDRQHVLGVEACIWTEHIFSMSKLYYMALPRLFGLAETGWSLQSDKSYPLFADSVLPVHLEKLDKSSLNYRVPTATNYIDTTIKASAYTFTAKAPFAGAKVYFSLNNVPPSDADYLYTAPVSIQLPAGKKMTIKTVVITPAGRRSVVTRTVIDASAQ